MQAAKCGSATTASISKISMFIHTAVSFETAAFLTSIDISVHQAEEDTLTLPSRPGADKAYGLLITSSRDPAVAARITGSK